MAMIKYMPNPQKKRGNNGRSKQHILHDSKQNKASLSRGRSIGQKFLKSTIYSKKMNYTEITMNLYTYKLNQIPGIIDEVIRCVVTDAPNLKRICFETGYGKPKKAIDIRKCASLFLLNTLGYTSDKSGSPKTFKFLNDHSNRIVIFPQEYIDFLREETERQEKERALLEAKKAKNKKKSVKKMKRDFVHNKWKKNRKYPAPKKKRQPLLDKEGQVLDPRFFTPGGDDDDDIAESEDDSAADSSGKEEIEETESTFLRNFANLQVVMQESSKMNSKKRSGNRQKRKNKKAVDIFEGVADDKEKFEYVAPDAWRYKNKRRANTERIYEADIGRSKLLESGEWECEFCSFTNDKHVAICSMCFNESFAKRSAAFLNVLADNNEQNEQSGNRKKVGRDRWHCEVCTFINSNESELCDMCGGVNVERDRYFDAQYEDYGDGFFQDAKPKRKQVGNVRKQRENEEKMETLEAANCVILSKKLKPMNVKRSAAVMDQNELHKNGMRSVHGQIASINREWQATVWKAHNDKQKRIEMLQRNGGGRGGRGALSVDELPKSVGFIPHSAEEKVAGNKNRKNGGVGQKKKVGNNRNDKRKLLIEKKRGKKEKRQTKGQQQVAVVGSSRRRNVKQESDGAGPGQINFEWIETLVSMGFEYDAAFDAIANTNSVGFNQALDYLMQNV